MRVKDIHANQIYRIGNSWGNGPYFVTPKKIRTYAVEGNTYKTAVEGIYIEQCRDGEITTETIRIKANQIERVYANDERLIELNEMNHRIGGVFTEQIIESVKNHLTLMAKEKELQEIQDRLERTAEKERIKEVSRMISKETYDMFGFSAGRMGNVDDEKITGQVSQLCDNIGIGNFIVSGNSYVNGILFDDILKVHQMKEMLGLDEDETYLPEAEIPYIESREFMRYSNEEIARDFTF